MQMITIGQEKLQLIQQRSNLYAVILTVISESKTQ